MVLNGEFLERLFDVVHRRVVRHTQYLSRIHVD
jgi:hypothetical protein